MGLAGFMEQTDRINRESGTLPGVVDADGKVIRRGLYDGKLREVGYRVVRTKMPTSPKTIARAAVKKAAETAAKKKTKAKSEG